MDVEFIDTNFSQLSNSGDSKFKTKIKSKPIKNYLE